jgi:acetyl esterase/lipase
MLPGTRAGIAALVSACTLAAVPAPVAAAHAGTETEAERASRIPLWTRRAPGSEHIAVEQTIVERSDDPAMPDRYIAGVASPYLVVYAPEKPDGRAALVIPGGGYQRVVLDKEGTALVPAFADSGGLTLFVLRYRLPGEGHRNARDVPLADAQRAMRVIRAQAAARGLDPERVGAMGFSAGGHVAASLATRYDEAVYPHDDAIDMHSARPAWVVLGYPVIDMTVSLAHPGSRERLLGASPSPRTVRAYSPQHHVDAETPPTFLLHAADDDAVPVGNSLAYHRALLDAGVDAELHVFSRGGHGFGIRGATGPLAAWPQLVLDWLDSLESSGTTGPSTGRP